jgi:aspartyl-tRNA(Asn)/glutamyl-tRNA(Gln) amidotransferase subunit C
MKDVENVAKLARLELNDTDKQKFADQLNNILEYIQKLNLINTNNAEPFISKGAEKNVMREDIEIRTISREKIMMNAPQKEGDFFKVKKVIE